MKKIVAAIVFSSIVLFGYCLGEARADLILYPGDDAYVDSFNPTTPRPANGLRTDYSYQDNVCSNTRYSYLRYNLSSLTVEVGADTKFRIYQTNAPLFSSAMLALWSTSDDWNGIDEGIGDENTLYWNNKPSEITKLDTKPSGVSPGWIEFSSSELSDYLNQERIANGGDNIASFLILWDECVVSSDAQRMEDSENFRGSGNLPHIYPYSPTAITLSAFSASSHANSPWVLLLGVGLLVLLLVAAIILRRRTKISA